LRDVLSTKVVHLRPLQAVIRNRTAPHSSSFGLDMTSITQDIGTRKSQIESNTLPYPRFAALSQSHGAPGNAYGYGTRLSMLILIHAHYVATVAMSSRGPTLPPNKHRTPQVPLSILIAGFYLVDRRLKQGCRESQVWACRPSCGGSVGSGANGRPSYRPRL
jgi:hypothetical protein